MWLPRSQIKKINDNENHYQTLIFCDIINKDLLMGVSKQMGKVVLKMAYTAEKSKKILRYLETNLNVTRGKYND